MNIRSFISKIKRLMSKKYAVPALIALLTLGYAAVNTVLTMNGLVGLGGTEFEVKFNRAILNGANRTKLFNSSKTSITLSYSDISSIDESVLEYELVNNSSQYDADATVTCSAAINDGTEFLYGADDSLTPETIRIEAGKIDSGYLKIKLNKREENETEENLGTLYNLVKNSSLGLDTDKGLNYDKTSEATNDTDGVYETKNTDTGKSVYFYRGNVDNNVVFGGKCWLVVRTTETDGVKLLYNGVPVNGQCLPFGNAMTFGLVQKIQWNKRTDDNAYVGYMYGTVGSDNYDDTHANINDSVAKQELDYWYEENIKDTKYEEYLEDTVWCNDRSLATSSDNVINYTYDSKTNEKVENDPEENTGLGYGQNLTYYAAIERSSSVTLVANPTLKCKNPNDRFSVSSTIGNGALTYPIATITNDELIYSGYTTGRENNSKKNFRNRSYAALMGGSDFYTLTPVKYSDKAYISNSITALNIAPTYNEHFVVPSISLNSSILVLQGDGSRENPYMLETEDINSNTYNCTLEVKPVARTSKADFDLDQLKTGDEYCIEDECFYVISKKDREIKMLAKYNLYVGKNVLTSSNTAGTEISRNDPEYGRQSRKAMGYTVTGSYPWIGVTQYSAFSNEYSGSYAQEYVNDYVNYLINISGKRNIAGSLITVEELEALGCDKASKTCNTSWYDWVTGLTYWVGSADSTNSKNTYVVGSDGFFGSSSYTNNNNRGIRPVITIYLDINDMDSSDIIDIGGTKMKMYEIVKSLSKGLDTSAGIDYEIISSSKNGTGVYETRDTDTGKSVYFYRGNVDNNVIFADYCWKILRTTETGGVKLIYNGKPDNGICLNTGEDTLIGKSLYSDNSSDNAYVGYMYGTPGSNNYNDTHANKNDSTIKKVVDRWYEDNLLGTKYEKMLEDTVYCNDRSIVTPGSEGNNNLTSKYGTLGYGTNNSIYGTSSRIANAALSTKPTYKCSQANDRFTVDSSNGNGALKYPIALLTADEAAFAGATRYNSPSSSNTSYFLYNNEKFYTMSPNWFDGRIAVGAVNANDNYVNGYFGLELASLEAGVRPVISLINDAYSLKGSGTISNPYIIKDPNELTEDDIPYYWLDDGIFSEYYLDAYKDVVSMTLEEKVGQLLIAHHSNTATDAITKYHVSGFTYFEADFLNKSEEAVKKMIADEQAASKIPLITAVDEEGGRVVRISSTTGLVANELSKYPDLFYTNVNNKNAWKLSRDLYAEGGFSLIETETKVKSGVLNRLGLNVNFAPVVDMAIEGAYISDRVIGLDATGTAQYAKTVLNASKGTNVSYTLKHFPGYGNNADTHSSSSVDNKTLEELMNNDIIPFKTGIDNGAEAIMVSHNTVAAVDIDNPASLSRGIHTLLTNDLHFTGIIITDALDMGALNTVEQKYVKAIQAGNHQILVQDYAAAHKEIMDAINDGTLNENQISKLVFRVLAWKYYKGLI